MSNGGKCQDCFNGNQGKIKYYAFSEEATVKQTATEVFVQGQEC